MFSLWLVIVTAEPNYLLYRCMQEFGEFLPLVHAVILYYEPVIITIFF